MTAPTLRASATAPRSIGTVGRASQVPAVDTKRPDRDTWQRTYQRALATNDVAMALMSTVVVAVARWRLAPPDSFARPDVLLAVLIPISWLGLLALRGAYDRVALGFGVDEFRRVISSGFHLLAFLVVAVYAVDSDLSRAVIFGSVAAAVACTCAGRFALRKVVHHRRKLGLATHRVLVVGMRDSVRSLTAHFDRTPEAGYAVAGACVPFGPGSLMIGDHNVPVLGVPDDIEAILERTADIDVLAIADTGVLSDGDLRRLSWGLADRGVDLVVAPAIADIAGPRISVDPVAGLPLLHVAEPHFNRATRLVKRSAETVMAAAALIVLSPVMLVSALAIKTTSRGPVLFKQERVGLDGRCFQMWKFRSMVRDAESKLSEIIDLNEHDGVLFKIADDPRVTKVGRVLRRLSIDELPQLAHVLRGNMALVGPRPPLPSEVERYDDIVRRRLLMRPGLTGLWQVSGRSDLSWQESVRLDVYYVDNWSLSLDLVILLKTLSAIVRARGAY